MLGENVTIAVVARERYSTMVECVATVLATAPVDARVLVVAGGSSRRIRRRLARLDSTRVEVIGPRRHLTSNEARSLALASATTPRVVFLDNDTIPRSGWIPPLLETMTSKSAVAVIPLIMQQKGEAGPISVHMTGGECRIEESERGRRLVESHRHADAPTDVVDSLVVERTDLLEFHCVMFDRDELVRLGGFDEWIESQGGHLDLCLRIAEAEGQVWIDPRSQVTFRIPTSLPWGDIGFYFGRWSPTINERSRVRFASKWGLTDEATNSTTWNFDARSRSYAWHSSARLIHRVARRWTPEGIALAIDRHFGRHVAESVLRFGPGWRHWRVQRRGRPEISTRPQ